MKKYATLIQEAISAAKSQDWKKALELNNELLERNNKDVGALNRIGLAHLQLEETGKAKKSFAAVIEIDKSNIIANKHLKNIKNKQKTSLSMAQTYFIKEPGKTKITVLHRLARKDLLKKLQVGQKCSLIIKGKHISIETEENKYVGALPDDLSFRLCKLIQRGNKYDCLIHKITTKSCSVHLKENRVSAKNKHILSFPTGKASAIQSISPLEEEFLIEKDIPININNESTNENKTDEFENTLEKINKGEEI